MLFNGSLHLGARERDVIFIIRHDDACDFFADAVRITDHAQLFDVRRILINLFHFVGIDVLAIGIDDDVFRAAYQVEIAFIIQTSQIARIKPAIDERFARGFFVAEVTQHHVRSSRDYFTDATGVRISNFHLNAGQRFADSAGEHSVLGSRHRQNRRRLGQSITFQNRKSESLKIALHFLIQRRAAADEIANATAHAFVNRIEQNLAKIQRCLVAQPGIKFHQ